MKYIILLGDETLTLESIKAINHYGSIRSYDVNKTRYCVVYDTEHIFYDYGHVSNYDYDEYELIKIPFDNICSITMVYKTEARMRIILQQDNFLKGVYVDNDFKLIVPIEEYIRLGMPVGHSKD